MRNHLRCPACLLPALLLCLPGRAEPVDRVAAVVNNDIIALSEVEQRAASELSKANSERDGEARAKLRKDALRRSVDVLIGEKLLEAAVKEFNIDVSDAEVDAGIDDVKKRNNIDGEQFETLLRNEGYTLDTYRQFMKKHLAKLKLINLKVRQKMKVTDEDLKGEYAKMIKLDSDDAEVHARHILVSVPPKATAEQVETARQKAVKLAQEARGPKVDFAELAKKKSDGPSAADGGDLGFFRRGVMVAEFERAVFKLEVGGVSEPVRTQYGWHVIKLEEKRAVQPKPFEDVKEQLKDRLLREQMEKYTEQYVQELRQQAIVDVKL